MPPMSSWIARSALASEELWGRKYPTLGENASYSDSLGQAHGWKPNARNAPSARGMCSDDVTSQIRFGTAGDKCEVYSAFSQVVCECRSISMTSRGTPMRSASPARSTDSGTLPPPPAITKLASGVFRHKATPVNKRCKLDVSSAETSSADRGGREVPPDSTTTVLGVGNGHDCGDGACDSTLQTSRFAPSGAIAISNTTSSAMPVVLIARGKRRQDSTSTKASSNA